MQAGHPGFVIRDIKVEDIPELTMVGRSQLGVDYISDEDFVDAMDDPHQFCLVAEKDGVPIGFAICREFGPEDEGNELALPDSPERDMVVQSDRIGLIDSVAVGEDAHGLGVGTAFCDSCTRIFSEDGCDLSISMAWVHFDGIEPIGGSLRRADFIRSDLVIEGYWNMWVDSEKGHQCPYCGAPCHCFAALWYRRI